MLCNMANLMNTSQKTFDPFQWRQTKGHFGRCLCIPPHGALPGDVLPTCPEFIGVPPCSRHQPPYKKATWYSLCFISNG